MRLIEFLEDSKKRGSLVDTLLSVRKNLPQTDLFLETNDGACLNSILEEILLLIRQGKPLYNRWRQILNGKERILSVPKGPLKRFNQLYLLPLIKTREAHENCYGGEKTWSVRGNLENHLPCLSVLSFDFKRAFEIFPEQDVLFFFSDLLQTLPENEEAAGFLTKISTVNYPNNRGLPLGSQCSMALFNRVLYSLDERISEKAQERDLRYSRWVDDITVSSPEFLSEEFFLGAVELADKFYKVSPEKIFFQNNQRDIYLLGYRITPKGTLVKNTREEKVKNKVSPLNFNDWFGGDKVKNYESWD